MARLEESSALDYMRDLYAPEDALLSTIAASLPDALRRIQVSALEGRLLQLLVTLHQPRSIVEIGSLAGYSAVWMARTMPEGGMLYAINKDAEHAALARKHFAASDVSQRLTLLEGDARDVLQTLTPKAPFDMVFIDADKISYPHYLEWAEDNVRKGGLIVGDNTLLFGTVHLDTPPDSVAPSTWNAMRAFNQRLADKSRYQTSFIPTEEGMTVAIKRF